MDFISNKQEQIEQMLKVIGVKEIEDLFLDIPEKLRCPRLTFDDGMSEYEGLKWMESIALRNTFPKFDHYLGAGAYDHYTPSLVGFICGKSEFLTSYTPYQAEASQGMLQSIFEFQTAICALTGLDVANASLYDGASACGEALLMTIRIQQEKNKVLVSKTINPFYLAVIKQYFCHPELKIQEIEIEEMEKYLDNSVAGVLVQYPNFFGCIEDLKTVSQKVKEKGALMVVCANPIVYGLYASALELGADIAVGDCQPFGLPLQFGGPYVGYMACKKEYVRQMPGRIVGETRDKCDKRGFVLTLQTREQHIRREKATSNICTNQALAALASLVGILWYGKEGIKKLALTNYQRASYLRDKLKEVVQVDDNPIFNEFVVGFKQPIDVVLKHFRKFNIEPGVPLNRFFNEKNNHLLVAVTETKSKQQLDTYIEVAKSL